MSSVSHSDVAQSLRTCDLTSIDKSSLENYGFSASALEPVLTHVTRLAALFHDLGKASALFQKKLRGTSGALTEPLRHEVLSYLMLWDALDIEPLEALSDVSWLDVLTQTPEVFQKHVSKHSLLSEKTTQWVSKILAGNISNSSRGESTGDSGKSVLLKLNQLRSTRPLLAAVLWLVLTHHGLPGTATDNNLLHHLHKDRALEEGVLQKNLQPAQGELPWQQKLWQDRVRKEAFGLLECLGAMPGSFQLVLTGPAWPLLVAHLGRPALILGDYKAAILKSETYDLAVDTVVLANTREQVTKAASKNREMPHGGDSLSTHLIAAAQECDLLYRLKATAAHSFSSTRVPEDCKTGIRAQSLPAQFQWQKDSADKVAAQVAKHPHAGFFGVVVSSTGAGKTLGGVRLMDAACQGRLRYTLPLSRKSLTLQAGRDYRSDTGLDPSNVAVVIGSRTTQVLGDIASQGADCLKRDPLSTKEEDNQLSMEEELWVDYAPAPGAKEDWRADFDTADEALFKTRKSLDLISAPILVTTADHLTGAVELLRGKSSLLTLRLMSSDLLLDEIDNYSAKDLVSLGKLVFCAGLFGRKVILMSATMSPPIVEAFYAAYCQGLQLHGALKGTPTEHLTAIVSNEASARVEVGTSKDAFLSAYKSHVQVFLDKSEARAARRKVGVLDISANESTDVTLTEYACFSQIYDECQKLHASNKLTDSATGVSYSVGFVRFNRASTCFKAAHYLSNSAPSTNLVVKYVTYHAKQTVLALNVIDTLLGRILKRDPSGALTRHPEVAAALQEAAERGLKDVVFIVLTTTLLETGRDQDYDWAILEPRSNRGEHQAMGRVRRHRPYEWTAQNITVLSHPLKNLTPKQGGWQQPGVERAKTPYVVRTHLHKKLQPLAKELGLTFKAGTTNAARDSAEQALPLKQWQEKVSARQCLEVPATYEENPIGALEQLEAYAHLVDNADLSKQDFFGSSLLEPRPLLAYLESPERGLPLSWAASHAKTTKFRSSDDERSEYQLFLSPKYDLNTVCIASTAQGASQDVPLKNIENLKTSSQAFWFDMPALIERNWVALQEALPDASPKLYQDAHGCQLASYAKTYLDLKGLYSPYLGFGVN